MPVTGCIYPPLNYYYMKRFFQQVSLTLFPFALVVMGIFGCSQGDKPNAAPQDNLTAKPALPHMWVGDSLSTADENNYHFLAGLLAYDLTTPETDSIFYPVNEFIGMIDTFGTNPCIKYVDAFPAAFGSSGAPNGQNNHLTVLFQPIDTCGNPTNYYLLPENAPSFDPPTSLQTSINAAAMIANYTTLKLNARLNAIVNPKDPVNHDGEHPALPATNTKHVIYLMKYLQELKGEISYQNGLSPTNPISGFKLFFSSKNPNGPSYDDRLYMLYELTKDDLKGNHNVFRIDTAGRVMQESAPFFSLKRGTDNGQMCPPTCTP